eukprot:1741344-Heterocapsa_arctica.AAC.1
MCAAVPVNLLFAVDQVFVLADSICKAKPGSSWCSPPPFASLLRPLPSGCRALGLLPRTGLRL